MRAAVLILASLVAVAALIRREPADPVRLAIQPDRLLADGYDTAVLSIEGQSREAPRISGAMVEEITGGNGKWQARIRSGVEPGESRIRVDLAGHPPSAVTLNSILDTRDSAGDGTPDFLRLEDQHDRAAFRRWFTYLAEVQYFQEPSRRPSEINDCAALIRYAYREALRAHDTAWAESAGLSFVPAFDSIARYRYPHTPLGASLYRVRTGSFHTADLNNGTFLQFADARTLWRCNTHLVSRRLDRAAPGDLLFFRHDSTYHSMIYLGESEVRPDGRRYIVYHTGVDGSNPGEMRRLSAEELTSFPRAEWRPLPGNPNFLGVARWNILRKDRNDVRPD